MGQGQELLPLVEARDLGCTEDTAPLGKGRPAAPSSPACPADIETSLGKASVGTGFVVAFPCPFPGALPVRGSIRCSWSPFPVTLWLREQVGEDAAPHIVHGEGSAGETSCIAHLGRSGPRRSHGDRAAGWSRPRNSCVRPASFWGFRVRKPRPAWGLAVTWESFLAKHIAGAER